MNSNRFSRRSLMQASGAVAGGLAASRLTGEGPPSQTAFGQVAAEKPALFVIYLNGGYNSLFCSADSYANPARFGVTAGNQRALANGLVIDAPTYGTLPQYALDHMSTVGIRHGITAHGA